MTLRPGNDWKDNAAYLARASLAAYQGKNKVKAFSKFKKLKLGSPSMVFTADKKDAALIASDSRNVVVAFRGSDKPNDWKGNAGIKFRKVKAGRVHSGLHDAMKSLLGRGVIAAMDANNVQDKDLWFTGHSRGGAIAVLMAQHLLEQYAVSRPERVPDFVYTYGAPRVGNFDYYNNYGLRDQTVIVINEDDPVPHLPPTQVFGYYHVAKQWHLNKTTASRDDVDDESFDAWKLAYGGAWDALRKTRIDVSDHDLDKGYIAKIDLIRGA